MIIDDNHAVAETVQAIIDSTDDLVTVGVAHDGGEGLSMALAQRPDLVITDITMPAGGPRLVESLGRYLPETAVLAFSGQPEDQMVLDMMRAGTMSYVAKGTPLKDLLGAIRRALDAQMTVSAAVAPLVDDWIARGRPGLQRGRRRAPR